MKRVLILFFLILNCKEAPKTVEASKVSPEVNRKDESISLDVYDYDGLKPLINKIDNKVHVVNFWATWCGPCIKELPYFEEINKKYEGDNVEVLLVSLDFPRQYDSKLKPFLRKKNIQSKVVCLDDVDQNRWLPAIDSTWSGALPATIIYKGNKRNFYEKSFTYSELENEVKQFLK